MEIMERCGGVETYTGEGRPQCDEGRGCVACYAKHHRYLDAHRPVKSPDFEEFYRYICMYKRIMQLGRLSKADLPSENLYDWIDELERSVRTGDYRHKMVGLEHVLADMNSGREST
jgi:hypothetical protein